MTKCAIENCINEATPRTRYCAACNAGWYYWHKKSHLDVMRRQMKLAVLRSRMTTFFTSKGTPNDHAKK